MHPPHRHPHAIATECARDRAETLVALLGSAGSVLPKCRSGLSNSGLNALSGELDSASSRALRKARVRDAFSARRARSPARSSMRSWHLGHSVDPGAGILPHGRCTPDGGRTPTQPVDVDSATVISFLLC
jgi:hypothetical protein